MEGSRSACWPESCWAARSPAGSWYWDGFVSTAAGLIAHSLCPHVSGYVVASHLSVEPGHRIALGHLGLRPLLDLKMRLGEGTGSVLAMGLIEAAAACLTEMVTFAEAGVSGSATEERD